MMPTGNRFGPWPRSGEIDIVEIRSNDDFTCRNKQVGNKLMGSTLHFGISTSNNIIKPWMNYYPFICFQELMRNTIYGGQPTTRRKSSFDKSELEC